MKLLLALTILIASMAISARDVNVQYTSTKGNKYSCHTEGKYCPDADEADIVLNQLRKSKFGQLERWLKRKNLDPNLTFTSPMIFSAIATDAGSLELLKLLIKYKVNVNMWSSPILNNNLQETPLMAVTMQKNLKGIEILLRAGADPYKKKDDYPGSHVLSIAVYTVNPKLLSYVLGWWNATKIPLIQSATCGERSTIVNDIADDGYYDENLIRAKKVVKMLKDIGIGWPSCKDAPR